MIEPLADKAAFAHRLIDWQRVHGRHDLPWQGTRDPYRIWLSEVMLQQTQVATVIPYYQRFISRFPDVQSLAQAALDDVLTSWSGLGYYSRARNLHRAALTICAAHGGRFPRQFDQVLALPGVGRSTAAAICALAWGERRAILDGNVKRVLARHAAIEGWPGDARVEATLWREAEARLPGAAPGANDLAQPPARSDAGASRHGNDPDTGSPIAIYTQALMDLGAGPCARRRPRCSQCPVASDCVAYVSDRVDTIPASRPRKPMPHRTSAVWLLLDQTSRVLLEQRPPSGIWGGLWSLPQSLDAATEARIRAADGALEKLAPIEHGFTHFRLTLEPLLVRMHLVDGSQGLVLMAAEPGRRWVALDQLASVALPAPVRALLVLVRGLGDGEQRPGEQRPGEQRPGEQRPRGRRPGGQRPRAQRPYGLDSLEGT